MNGNPGLSPEQKQAAAEYALVTADMIRKGVYAFMGTLAAWASLKLGWHVSIPFLPVWIAVAAGLVALRHISRTVGENFAEGTFAASHKNFQKSLLMAQQMNQLHPVNPESFGAGDEPGPDGRYI